MEVSDRLFWISDTLVTQFFGPKCWRVCVCVCVSDAEEQEVKSHHSWR